MTDLSKEAQLRRSPGKENKPCPTTGELIRDCNCYTHRNARNRKSGVKKQKQAIRQLAIGFGVNPGNIGNEETTRLPLRIEWKSGQQVEHVEAFYIDCRAQADSPDNKAVGDFRSFAAGATGSSHQLVVIALDDLTQLLRERR